MGLTVVEIDRRRALHRDLTELAASIDRIRPRVEQVEPILAWRLADAVQRVTDAADGVLELEDGSRLDLGADAAVRP